MRRWAITSALAILFAAGCGTTDPTHTTTASDDLTIYTALPMHGAQAPRSRDVIDGERLALILAGGRVGPYTVRLRSLDDSSVKKDGWDPEATLQAIKLAVDDPSTIAFIGDLDAGATALSLPKTNERDLLQVIPAATYDGFTGGDGRAPGEPEKYQPSSRLTFGTVALTDEAQSRVIADALKGEHCERVAVLRAPTGFDASLAELIERTITHRGMEVVNDDKVPNTDPDTQRKTGERLVKDAVDCATFAGSPSDAPGPLLRAIHAAAPEVRFVLPAALADAAVAKSIATAGPDTMIVGPPPAGPRFSAAFERRFGRRPGPWAAYGYDAMQRALKAIASAGAGGNDRRAVVAAFLQQPRPVARLALWRATAQGLELDRELPQA
ncbi:MAG: transporter substrate-binding protein [Solirubrobacterales bacterium]|nr:transporter substrate-binding protein [Solirubrobacterales bacterium]